MYTYIYIYIYIHIYIYTRIRLGGRGLGGGVDLLGESWEREGKGSSISQLTSTLASSSTVLILRLAFGGNEADSFRSILLDEIHDQENCETSKRTRSRLSAGNRHMGEEEEEGGVVSGGETRWIE